MDQLNERCVLAGRNTWGYASPCLFCCVFCCCWRAKICGCIFLRIGRVGGLLILGVSSCGVFFLREIVNCTEFSKKRKKLESIIRNTKRVICVSSSHTTNWYHSLRLSVGTNQSAMLLNLHYPTTTINKQHGYNFWFALSCLYIWTGGGTAGLVEDCLSLRLFVSVPRFWTFPTHVLLQ